MSLTETTAERIAVNQDAFREANENIADAAERLNWDTQLLPFICECPDRTCTEIASLKRHEYECVRRHGETFLVVPGHEVTEVNGVAVANVAQRFDRYSLMAKIGEAAEHAKELDPRSA